MNPVRPDSPCAKEFRRRSPRADRDLARLSRIGSAPIAPDLPQSGAHFPRPISRIARTRDASIRADRPASVPSRRSCRRAAASRIAPSTIRRQFSSRRPQNPPSACSCRPSSRGRHPRSKHRGKTIDEVGRSALSRRCSLRIFRRSKRKLEGSEDSGCGLPTGDRSGQKETGAGRTGRNATRARNRRTGERQ